ncbi:hypothetical protein [Nostoc sp.]|uniref:hypothetical protein n=1 Tax=Nostoc sp. TaxID=1180 RepID=UPI002FF6C966
MKVLSFLAISTACSISLSFLAKAQAASIVLESENNHSFATRQFLPTGISTVDGQLSPGNVDYYTFPDIDPGKLFDVQVNSNTVDSLLGLLDHSGKIREINDDRSDFSFLPELTGIVPTSGSLNLAVSGLRDTNLAGEHSESGSYTLSLKTFSLPQPSTNTTLINSGFENGDFTGWTTLGKNTIETSVFGSGSTQGKYEALLSTGGGSFATKPNDPNESDPIEEFLGLQTGSLDNLVPGLPVPPPSPPAQLPHGSAIQQKFTAKAGEILTFDWNFLTNELAGTVVGPSLADFSFVSLNSSDGLISSLSELANAGSFQSLMTSRTQFFQETGFHTFSFTIPTDGTYTLGLGVSNKFDNFTDSGLLVDNVKLEPTSVPEPTAVLGVLVFGTLGAGSVLKRKWLAG